jgi:hypothetical protein
MITIVKIQLPLSGNILTHALAYNKENTFRSLIHIDSNKELMDKIFSKDEDKVYCKCEVQGDKIVSVIEKIPAQDAGF